MKKMIWIFLSCFHLLTYANDSNYSISVGDADKERLVILNEIYNPPSLKFLDDCQLKKGAKVLEIGCGIGLTTQALADYVGDEGFVLGTDLSEKLVFQKF